MFSYQPKLDVTTYLKLSLIHNDLRRKSHSNLKTNVQKSNVNIEFNQGHLVMVCESSNFLKNKIKNSCALKKKIFHINKLINIIIRNHLVQRLQMQRGEDHKDKIHPTPQPHYVM
jgi:hypothetical protein